jgi:methylthioribulose-1-phosphate dehydratase
LLHDPELLLLDEPYTGLDQHASRVLAEVLEGLRDGNRTVIMTTHNLQEGLSGCDRAAIMVVDLDGNPVATGQRSSAETLLHTQLYKRVADIGCVLHTHSLTQTVASRLYSGIGHVRLEGYELLKAITGNTSHETVVDLPVLPNTQDMRTLAAQVDALLDRNEMWGYLIDGHGLYAWGRDMAEARRHLDAFEFLLGCELELRKLRR